MDLKEGHRNLLPGQVGSDAFPARVEGVRFAGARLAVANDGGCLEWGNPQAVGS